MKERWPQAVLALFGIAALVILLVMPHRSRAPVEPSYLGKPWSYWAEQMDCFQHRSQACAAIRVIGTNAIPLLLQRMREGDILPAEAVTLLKPVGASALPALVPAFHDSNDAIRWVAAESIVSLRAEAKPYASLVLPGLMDLIWDPNADTRFAAIAALAGLGADAMPALPVLIHALGDSNIGPEGRTVYVREKAAETLGKLGPGAQAAVPVLTQCLQHPDWYTRQGAALGLWCITHQVDPSVPVLSEMLTNTDSTIRQTAALALSRIAVDSNLSASLMAKIEAAKARNFTMARMASPDSHTP